MRLINATTLKVETFESNIFRYAILSHRWTDSELTYKDYEKGRGKDNVGYRKVLDSCRIAKSYTIDWIWIDTVCIDKRSSAELSEAINSMFRWYEEAEVCFAYLGDVEHDNDEDRMLEQFRESVWFKRGWTLQELIAPRLVIFFDSMWQVFGHKRIRSIKMRLETQGTQNIEKATNDLELEISNITGISVSILNGTEVIYDKSVAQKMSWLASRTTTRQEDLAYCVLGIFAVNLPLLYGESSQAWTRLQEEIIRTNNDESLFAWPVPGHLRLSSSIPLLAPWPRAFAKCGEVKYRGVFPRKPYAITNGGLALNLKAGTMAVGLNRQGLTGLEKVVVFVLNCMNGLSDPAKRSPKLFPPALIECTCGHYDRWVEHFRAPLLSLTTRGEPELTLLNEDVTLYVHTTAAMKKNCARRGCSTENAYPRPGDVSLWLPQQHSRASGSDDFPDRSSKKLERALKDWYMETFLPAGSTVHGASPKGGVDIRSPQARKDPLRPPKLPRCSDIMELESGRGDGLRLARPFWQLTNSTSVLGTEDFCTTQEFRDSLQYSKMIP